ncbi:glycosyltransferase [Arcobacter cloacae]|uniref:Alpha-L-Rha alpha-1,3-L-rhamnosyltransferase n=1 Tax=Arcobacter cloacae TaxID=1054034 RepID=A0A6M8NPN1_9BACT|nr:glycosyltransferase [Arcobacter cloacae]QKF90552.1 glycosyltransferase, family 2 [Arcobacter cloacae]RXI37897.1 alpha-L-Rha alpha-1,3-L-rhamnosyltransferase [Arcobacter cloacae]
MKKNSLVSIAMCTYNGSRFIKEQLDSILDQTYDNLEIVIVDDNSKDNTVEIINEYIQKDKRIKLFENTYNLGFVKNFEKAISLCVGDYIALADQDDIWKTNKLEIFLNEIKTNILIYSDSIVIDENSNISNKEFIRSNANLVKGKCNKSFIFSNCVSGNTLMFKKEIIPYIIPIPLSVSFHDIWIAFVASTIGTITYTEESYTYYRRYNEQVTKHVEKNYTSLFDKFRKKEHYWLNFAQNIVNYCLAFKSVKNLDKETIDILNTLIEHYSNYQKGFFSYKIYKCLKKYKDELFKIKKIKARNRYLFRFSSRNNLLKILFYSI